MSPPRWASEPADNRPRARRGVRARGSERCAGGPRRPIERIVAPVEPPQRSAVPVELQEDERKSAWSFVSTRPERPRVDCGGGLAPQVVDGVASVGQPTERRRLLVDEPGRGDDTRTARARCLSRAPNANGTPRPARRDAATEGAQGLVEVRGAEHGNMYGARGSVPVVGGPGGCEGGVGRSGGWQRGTPVRGAVVVAVAPAPRSARRSADTAVRRGVYRRRACGRVDRARMSACRRSSARTRRRWTSRDAAPGESRAGQSDSTATFRCRRRALVERVSPTCA